MKNESIGKSFEGPDGETFEDFDACVAHFDGDDAVDDPEAFCAWLEGDGKDALSDPDAEDVLTDLRVEFVSAVDGCDYDEPGGRHLLLRRSKRPD